MIIIIDNYDSFTYNLYQYAGMINPDIQVIRNDKITITELKELNPSHLIISPGPGYPIDAGISVEAIKQMGEYCPVLGICLGHQAIGEAFGGLVNRSPFGPVHGKKSKVSLAKQCPIFSNMGDTLEVARYHSLVVDASTLPEKLQVTAMSEDGLIMGLQHRQLPVFGLQFHPESVLTENGLELIKNFLEL